VARHSLGSYVRGRHSRNFFAIPYGLSDISPTFGRSDLGYIWGGISALAWALSVVGTLIWEDFGIVSSIKWNSWFNFFAAGFAATAVGYSAK
jgi:hypothetical protein